MFGLGKLFYVVLLIVNSIAVLSEDRFLAKSKPAMQALAANALVGWSTHGQDAAFIDQSQSVKTKLINLISAVRTLLRSEDTRVRHFRLTIVPLIAINTVVIIYELIMG